MAGNSGSQTLAINIQRKGWAWVDVGVPGPDVAPPGNRRTNYTTQEYPWHPKAYVNAGRFPDAVANFSQIKTDAIVRQEQPRHPLPFTTIGVQGPNVANPGFIKSLTIVPRQEPWHPRPFTFSLTPILVSPVIRSVFTRQEYPAFHPKPFTIPPPRSASFGQEAVRGVFVKQEQPWQPLWPRNPVYAGQATNSEFCFGMILGN